ncbi:hypothetical protein I310_05586 [Cryptococcus deuterogattii CA1014]|nr:hypothetical protein I310_05586 [Cryptococcus deuterogattii CA1014]
MVHQPDNPPVATIESGGPATSPTLEERPHEFRYEIVQGYFIQNGPQPKHTNFEDLVSLLRPSPASFYAIDPTHYQCQLELSTL